MLVRLVRWVARNLRSPQMSSYLIDAPTSSILEEGSGRTFDPLSLTFDLECTAAFSSRVPGGCNFIGADFSVATAVIGQFSEKKMSSEAPEFEC